MDEVDFGYVGRNGFTIYRSCFQKYIHARFELRRPKAEWSKIVSKTETVFEYLVDQGTQYGFDVDSILEIPGASGESCFASASQCSKKISNYIIKRGIKVNNISTDMMTPDFAYQDLAIQMMKK